MAQTIKHRRGKLEYCWYNPINGELIIASFWLISTSRGFTVCWGWRKCINSSNKILTGRLSDLNWTGSDFDHSVDGFLTIKQMTKNYSFLERVYTNVTFTTNSLDLKDLVLYLHLHRYRISWYQWYNITITAGDGIQFDWMVYLQQPISDETIVISQ